MSKIQTEIPQLERHLKQLEQELDVVDRSDRDIPRQKHEEAKPRRLLDLPKGRQESKEPLNQPAESTPDNVKLVGHENKSLEDGIQQQVGAPLLTSTPKAEAAIAPDTLKIRRKLLAAQTVKSYRVLKLSQLRLMGRVVGWIIKLISMSVHS